MKIKVVVLLTFLLFNLKNTIADNEKYQITLLLSPTYETFTGPNRQYKLSYNFGIDYKHYLDPSITFQTGIIYQNKGFRAPGEIIDGVDKVELFITSLHYVSIPTNLNLHIQTSIRSRLLLTAGMTNGYNIYQSERIVKVSKDQLQQYRDEYGDTFSDKSREIDVFSKRFTGLNLGVGFMQFVKKKIVFEVHPIYTVQLNRPYSDNYKVIGDKNFKLKSIAIDLKIGYYFNKQISQKGESF